MFEGETADCLALANTAILMRLIDQLIEHGVMDRLSARALLRDAVKDLEDCSNASRAADAIKIVREELIPRFM